VCKGRWWVGGTCRWNILKDGVGRSKGGEWRELVGGRGKWGDEKTWACGGHKRWGEAGGAC